MKAYMLTTKDNPFDPVTMFDAWYNWDVLHGYDCCGYLDRVSFTSDQLTDEENQAEINRAIDEIIAYDVADIYRRVEIPQKYIDEVESKFYANVLDDEEQT